MSAPDDPQNGGGIVPKLPTPPPEPPPGFDEPFKWIAFHIRRDGPMLKKAPLGTFAVGLICLVLGWIVTSQIEVPNKNAQIETLRTDRDYYKDKWEQLKNQTPPLTPAQESSLVKKALKIADHVEELGRNWRGRSQDGEPSYDEYCINYQHPLEAVVRELLESGAKPYRLPTLLSIRPLSGELMIQIAEALRLSAKSL